MDLKVTRAKERMRCTETEAENYIYGYNAAKRGKAKAIRCQYWLAGWHDWHIENNTGIRS